MSVLSKCTADAGNVMITNSVIDDTDDITSWCLVLKATLVAQTQQMMVMALSKSTAVVYENKHTLYFNDMIKQCC